MVTVSVTETRLNIVPSEAPFILLQHSKIAEADRNIMALRREQT
jgi:hypothetical protein